MAEIAETVTVPIDSLEPSDWNPNVEDLGTFNELVEVIQKHGFTDPPIVVKTGDVYRIVSGEHRWKAAKQAGLDEIPVVVKKMTVDEQKIETVRLNYLRGKLDPEKFSKLWVELSKKYDRDELMKRMGMGHREKELERLIGRTRKGLPKDMQAEFDKRAEKIQTVEDLAAVVQSIYARSKATLDDHGWMAFTYGGANQLMIRISKDTSKKLRKLLEQYADEGRHADDLAAEIVTELADRR